MREARITLLDRTGIVPFGEQMDPYNVLSQPATAFLIRLPPRVAGDTA